MNRSFRRRSAVASSVTALAVVEFTVQIPGVLAAVVLSTLPMVVLYVLGRRYLVTGLTAGFSR